MLFDFIEAYKHHRRFFGVRQSFKYSGGDDLMDVVKKIAIWIVAAIALIYLLSDLANAKETIEAHQDETGYIQALQALANKCTAQGLNEIWIGKEQYLCGAYPTGVKK